MRDFVLYVKHLLAMSFTALHLRETFLKRLFEINDNFWKLTLNALFKYILAMCNEDISTLSSIYSAIEYVILLSFCNYCNYVY